MIKTLQHARREFRQFRNRLSIGCRYYLHHHQPKTRLFVIAEPRTGSTLLISYLNSLATVTALEEILNPHTRDGIRRNWVSRSTILRHLDHSLNVPGEIVAAKVMIHHLKWRTLTPEDLLARYSNARFVVLYRQNMLRQFVSKKMMVLTGQARLRGSSTRKIQRVEIDPVEFRAYCLQTRMKYDDFVQRTTLGHDRLAVFSYEELASDPQRAFEKHIFPLLGSTLGSVSTNMRRQNPEEPSELVANYHDIREFAESPEAILSISREHPQTV